MLHVFRELTRVCVTFIGTLVRFFSLKPMQRWLCKWPVVPLASRTSTISSGTCVLVLGGIEKILISSVCRTGRVFYYEYEQFHRPSARPLVGCAR